MPLFNDDSRYYIGQRVAFGPGQEQLGTVVAVYANGKLDIRRRLTGKVVHGVKADSVRTLPPPPNPNAPGIDREVCNTVLPSGKVCTSTRFGYIRGEGIPRCRFCWVPI